MDTDKQKETIQEEALEYRMSAREYIYGEYITWPEEFRCELIDGNIYLMSPGPSESYAKGDTVEVGIFERFSIELGGIFQ